MLSAGLSGEAQGHSNDGKPVHSRSTVGSTVFLSSLSGGKTMRRTLFIAAFAGIGLLAGCADPTGPAQATGVHPQFAASPKACWGQATKVFARLGEMGKHAAGQPTPRVGLANLARLLYQAGTIPEPTMAALGAFVAADLGLSIDACM
jgi:hypothetical protein